MTQGPRSRRDALKLLGASVAIAATASAKTPVDGTPYIVNEVFDPPRTRFFGLGDVRLGAGPFRDAQQRDAGYLLSLEPDRMLANFRANAGLAPRAPVYGGWESVEPLIKGPSARPKSKEEAIEIYTKYLSELDEKAAAFLKANPEDAHRWDLMLHMIKIDKMREFVGGEASAPEKITKDIESIIAAKDASEETKGFASYIQVMEAGEDEEKFQKLAEAHIKAFPKFEGNAQIEGKIKAAEMSKTLKDKPLELAFRCAAKSFQVMPCSDYMVPNYLRESKLVTVPCKARLAAQEQIFIPIYR